MCWIGSMLFFIAANLLIFDSDKMMQNIFMFTNLRLRSVDWFFYVLLFVYGMMLSTGVYVQYDIYKKKRELLRFSYLSVQTDEYKAID